MSFVRQLIVIGEKAIVQTGWTECRWLSRFLLKDLP